jgi:hypothetical protein
MRASTKPSSRFESRKPSSQVKRRAYSRLAPTPDSGRFDDAPEQLVEEGAQELPLVAAHPLGQLRVAVGAPVDGDSSPTDPQGGDEQMPAVFRRPVEREADGSCRGQLSGDGARVRERQLVRRESCVVEQARQALRGSLKVIKEAREGGLAARLHGDERAHEIRGGLLLMPVCGGQDAADILAEASGQRAWLHGRTNALTSG